MKYLKLITFSSTSTDQNPSNSSISRTCSPVLLWHPLLCTSACSSWRRSKGSDRTIMATKTTNSKYWVTRSESKSSMSGPNSRYINMAFRAHLHSPSFYVWYSMQKSIKKWLIHLKLTHMSSLTYYLPSLQPHHNFWLCFWAQTNLNRKLIRTWLITWLHWLCLLHLVASSSYSWLWKMFQKCFWRSM